MFTKNHKIFSLLSMVFFMALVFPACNSDDTTGESSYTQTDTSSKSGGAQTDTSSETDDSLPTSPSIWVYPTSYDFGIVTPYNKPTTLRVLISNIGNADLDVSEIILSDKNNYDLNLGIVGFGFHCGSSPTIPADVGCEFWVDFIPTDFGEFSSTLTIVSNDPDYPTFDLDLTGTNVDEITELNVKINQIDLNSCPEVKAYVSVADQGGFAVPFLAAENFLVTEGLAAPVAPNEVSFVSGEIEIAHIPISVVLIMDYSESTVYTKNFQIDMEDSLKTFVDEMESTDEAEIIKFNSDWEVVQALTSDKDALKAEIDASWNRAPGTVLFDAVYKAIQDLSVVDNDRKAVIVITDGADNGSSLELSDVIDLGREHGIPVFTSSFADYTGIFREISLFETVIIQMAESTDGRLFGLTPDNLKTIYYQLARVLNDQYVLTYTSAGDGAATNLTIEANLNDVEGFDTKNMTTCPQ